MRRILLSLAASTALGATVPWTLANEPPVFPTQPTGSSTTPEGTAAQLFGAHSSGPNRAAGKSYSDLLAEEGVRSPSAERRGLPRAGSLSDTRANDLFRRDLSPREATRSASGAAPLAGNQLLEEFQRVSGEQPNEARRDVVHAEYERAPGQGSSVELMGHRQEAMAFPPVPGSGAAQPELPRSASAEVGFGNNDSRSLLFENTFAPSQQIPVQQVPAQPPMAQQGSLMAGERPFGTEQFQTQPQAAHQFTQEAPAPVQNMPVQNMAGQFGGPQPQINGLPMGGMPSGGQAFGEPAGGMPVETANRTPIQYNRLVEPISTSPTGASMERVGPPSGTVFSSRGVTFSRATTESQNPVETASMPVVHAAGEMAVRPTMPQVIHADGQMTSGSGIQQVSAIAADPVSLPMLTPRTAAVESAAVIPDSSIAPTVSSTGALARTIRSGPQSPSLSIEWVTRSGINVGQECDCSLVVRNTGIITAKNVELSAEFPSSVRLVSLEPAPVETESRLGWRFDELQPGQEKVVKIVMIPSTPGKIDTKADVRFSGAALTSLTVAEPMIEVSIEGPQKVLIGEPASQTVTVRNPGSGIATNVQVEAVIPPGLEHARGDRLVMEVGSLNPGENRSVRLALAAVKGGKQVVQVQARADGNLLRNTSSEVYIVAPTLTAEIEGPTLRYLGRPAVYTLKVRNDGEINVENVRVMHKMPDGFEVLETDRGAQFDRPNRIVNWFVGRLAAGQSSEMKLTVRPDQIGNFTHFIRATSEHGAISDAQFTTSVEGTPSLAMQIRDLNDPVEVGIETAYEITVKNEGSAAARGINLACEIPAGLEIINAQGPVECIRQRDLVTFNPVAELASGNSITYRIHVRGNTNGHHRLRARLSSDSNPEPITADEVTRFYGE